MAERIVVAGALVHDGAAPLAEPAGSDDGGPRPRGTTPLAEPAVLVAQRDRPPELAGLWELPGGKVADGESEADALRRELREELGIEVQVGQRLGDDVVLNATTVLRAYHVTSVSGTPQPHDHRALRWLRADELSDVDWVPADTAWLPALAAALNRRLES